MWTPEYREQLGQAQSAEEMARVAIQLLSVMAEAGKPIHQICGPLTTGGLNCPVLNRDRFKFAIAQAQRYLLVFDQMPFEDEIKRLQIPHGQILNNLYRPIFESGHIAVALFLPNWMGSKGACLEREFAMDMNILVRGYPPHWLPQD